MLVTALVTIFLLRRIGFSVEEFQRLETAAWRPEPLTLAFSVTLLLAGYLLSAAAWGRMVAEVGGGRIPFLTATRLFFTANLARYIPGKVWQVAGLGLLSREAGIPASLGMGAAVLGQGLSLLAAGLMGSFVLLGWEGLPRWLTLALLAGGVFLLGLATIPGFFRTGAGWVFRRIDTVMPGALEKDGLFAVRWTVLHLGIWIVYGLAFWLLTRSLGLPGGVLELTSAFAAAYLAGYIAVFAPAGLGVREGVLAAFLEPSMGAGAALGLAVVARIWTTVVEALPGGIAAWTTLGGGRPGAPQGGERYG